MFSGLWLRSRIVDFKKLLCDKFGHKEKWIGDEYFKTGRGELKCVCSRCGKEIFKCFAEMVLPSATNSAP